MPDCTTTSYNDWYFDSYADAGEGLWGDEWYQDEYYSGLYDNDIAENDWFFDSYDPGDEGFWDV